MYNDGSHVGCDNVSKRGPRGVTTKWFNKKSTYEGIRPFPRYGCSNFICWLAVIEKVGFDEPWTLWRQYLHVIKWTTAMEKEIKSLQKIEIWTLDKIPNGKKVIGCKWIFKKKDDAGDMLTKPLPILWSSVIVQIWFRFVGLHLSFRVRFQVKVDIVMCLSSHLN